MVIDMNMILKMVKEKEEVFNILKAVIDMKVNIEMIKQKEKELNIGISSHGKEIDMKAIGEMIKEKEKEYIILTTEIEGWGIIIMINQSESM